MLPAAHRMRRREEFTRAVRQGRRQGSTHLVAHLLLPGPATGASQPMGDPATPPAVELTAAAPMPTPHPARVGFVVSKAVGPAVVRTRVKRRLRAVVAARLPQLPSGSLLVVRANPASAQATSAELAASLDRALGRLLPTPAVGA
ncbi:ribonuclease P protein component [Angustibacter peucedani]